MLIRRTFEHRRVFQHLLIIAVTTTLLLSLNIQTTKSIRLNPDSAPVTVISSTADQLVLRASLPELNLQIIQGLDGNLYTVASTDGAGSVEIGKPGVPVYGNWILIPNGRTASVQVDPGEPITIPDVLLYPVQIPHADMDDAPYGPFVKDDAVYEADSDYPGVFAQLGPAQDMRGQQMAILWIFPYQQNPHQRMLKKYPNLTVTVSFDGTVQPIPTRLISGVFEALYNNLALNAEAVISSEKEAIGPIGPANKYGYDYLILTTSKFQQAANQLAAWRTQTGYKTAVSINLSYLKASDIRSALLSAYQNWGIVPEYVLFLGDAEYIPTNYASIHPGNDLIIDGEKNTQGLTGTDFYYSTMQYDSINPWSDWLPDFLLGRISVDTAQEALARIQGIIDYEKSPPLNGSFYDTVTLAADFQDGGTYYVLKNGNLIQYTIISDGVEDSRFTQTSEDLGIFFEGSTQNKIVNRLYYADSAVTPSKWNDSKQGNQVFVNWNGPSTKAGGSIPPYLYRPGFSWNANTTGITNAIQSGSFLVVHRGHGARDHWAKPYFPILDVAQLQNPSLLPVVWSFNCETGWFDNETDFKGYTLKDQTSSSSEALSEYFERPFYAPLGDYGALGVVANTRISFTGYNDHLVEGMTNTIWPQYLGGSSPSNYEIYSLSAALNQGKNFMETFYTAQDPYMWSAIEGFHWFGDPASEIRTESPKLLLVVIPAVWEHSLYRVDFPIHVEIGGSSSQSTVAMEGAKVTISKASEPQDYWVGMTDGNGNITFPGLTTSALGTYSVTVTAPNTIPSTTTFESEPGAAGGILLDKETYSFSTPILVKAADSNLKGSGALSVTLLSSGGDNEIAVLSEVGNNSGFFTGSLPIVPGAVHIQDGALQVLDSQTITAQYSDADDGTGHSALVTDTAHVDCLPPGFSGLVTASVQDFSVHLTWDPASDPNGPVLYTIFRDLKAGPPIGDPIGETWSLSFNDYDFMPGVTRYYVVRARDMLGNQENNTAELAIATPGIYLPLVLK